MRLLRKLLDQIPGLRPAYRTARSWRESLHLKGRSAEDVFTAICRGNRWGAADSVSGGGSDLVQTAVARAELPHLFREYLIHSMLDIPCGDFHWMKHVDLAGIDYTGADIVAELIRRNGPHEKPNVHFRKLNLIEDKLPKVDLVFCRDCLVHLSFEDTFRALRSICKSGSTYLLTTTFTGRLENRDITTGQWRTLNLEVAPYSFPPPLMAKNEECTEGDGAYADKSLGLWRVADIARTLALPFRQPPQ